MKVKTLLAMALVFCITAMYSIGIVHAENGPSDEYSVIHISSEDEDYYIYDDDYGIDNTSLPGATYDLKSNTLTISNIKGYYLWIENMGEDFKINVVGDNELDSITVHGEHYKTNLHITGYGNLTINKEKNSISGLDVFWGYVEIDDSVNITIDVAKEIDGWDDYEPSVIFTRNTIEKAIDSIILRNGDTPEFTTEPYCYEDDSPYLAIKLNGSKADYTGVIVEKDNRKYFVDKYVGANDEIDYYLYYGDIKSLTYNDTTYYFLDETGLPFGSDKWTLFEGTEELENAGYTITSDNWDVNWINYNSFYKMYDSDEENEYAIYSDFNANKSVYDITNVKVTLDDGQEHTLVIQNNSVSVDTLHYKKICTGWEHSIGLDSIRIKAKRYQVMEGDNQTYIIGENGISFKINADYSLFIDGGKVYIDDEEITDYTAKEGSTIITLSSDYLSKLDKGDHTIRVTFNNGNYAEANFSVVEESDIFENPNTYDSIMIYLYMLISSLISLVLIKYIYKKISF